MQRRVRLSSGTSVAQTERTRGISPDGCQGSLSSALRLNIVGSAEVVKELLTKFSISFNGTGGRITDRFPDARGEGFSDVNVEIVDEDADELIEWCEAHKLECEVF